ncbi:hypothetical protein LAZ67_5002836 [Cordylochernes scorpioides]|uniref:Mariner Mos1 transposase n=1 Tax=Cordylochernes scorpioides TaxID=51811 RepID=A0ABY6KGP5_9ARAC|nr:hypothetical protein LAZ67_5002836 [Cordylochernes scorpioides]
MVDEVVIWVADPEPERFGNALMEGITPVEVGGDSHSDAQHLLRNGLHHVVQLHIRDVHGAFLDIALAAHIVEQFKSGNFNLEDEERPGAPPKFEGEYLEARLDEDPTQRQKELAKTFRVTQPAIFYCLKEIGMIRKVINWVPYELNQDIAPSDYYLFGSMQHSLADQHFSHYDEVKKWIDKWIAAKEPAFFRNGIRQLPERWEKVVASDGQYFEH